MKVYMVQYGNGDPSRTFATQKEAIANARCSALEVQNPTDSVEQVLVVEQLLVPPFNKLIVRLINGDRGQYVQSDRVIATFDREPWSVVQEGIHDPPRE